MNRFAQYNLQLVQVFFVGLTLGTMRTVVPAVAESDFGVRKGDLALISAFVIAFGIVKGIMNFIAGAASETFGRRRVLVAGWLIALPIPWMIWSAPHDGGWWWIVAATVMLGVNQGLTWSMTLTSKLDLTRPERRGLTNGLNEFCGYFAVAIAGVITAFLADRYGARSGLLMFGYAVILPALMMSALFVRETRDVRVTIDARPSDESDRSNDDRIRVPSTREAFVMSFREPRFFAMCQCGLVEKFIDCLVWIALPLFLVQKGIDLRHVGWIPGIYAATWGGLQIVTGPLSDRIGRLPLIVGGMLMCAVAAVLFPAIDSVTWWGCCAGTMGVGMAMLYPTLGAAVADLAQQSWRGTALGIYRFWRDLGYAVGAVLLGTASAAGLSFSAVFVCIGCVVGLSGAATAVLGRRLQADRSRGDDEEEKPFLD